MYVAPCRQIIKTGVFSFQRNVEKLFRSIRVIFVLSFMYKQNNEQVK